MNLSIYTLVISSVDKKLPRVMQVCAPSGAPLGMLLSTYDIPIEVGSTVQIVGKDDADSFVSGLTKGIEDIRSAGDPIETIKALMEQKAEEIMRSTGKEEQEKPKEDPKETMPEIYDRLTNIERFVANLKYVGDRIDKVLTDADNKALKRIIGKVEKTLVSDKGSKDINALIDGMEE